MTADQPDTPMFAFAADGEVMAFDSIDTAEGWMEAIDVLDGEYVDAFLVDGERLLVNAVDNVSPVVIRRTGEFDLDGLRQRVAEGGERNGYEGSNPDLHAVAEEILRNDWAVRWPRWPKWLDRWMNGDGPTA